MAWGEIGIEDEEGRDHRLTVEFSIERYREGRILKYEITHESIQLDGQETTYEALCIRFGRAEVDAAIQAVEDEEIENDEE